MCSMGEIAKNRKLGIFPMHCLHVFKKSFLVSTQKLQVNFIVSQEVKLNVTIDK